VADGYAGETRRKVATAMLTIRPASENDCEAIHEVHLHAVRGLPARDKGREGIEAWLRTRTADAHAQEMAKELYIVAEHGDRIVGWAALNIPDAEISNVFVDPASQRQGVGKAMLEHLEALAAQSDLQAVSLKATGTAIAFYLGTGYRSEQPLAANADWALLRKSL
jgi:N-acetylglutamate synthase-like GNAT family acetyltransferase